MCQDFVMSVHVFHTLINHVKSSLIKSKGTCTNYRFVIQRKRWIVGIMYCGEKQETTLRFLMKASLASNTESVKYQYVIDTCVQHCKSHKHIPLYTTCKVFPYVTSICLYNISGSLDIIMMLLLFQIVCIVSIKWVEVILFLFNSASNVVHPSVGQVFHNSHSFYFQCLILFIQ